MGDMEVKDVVMEEKDMEKRVGKQEGSEPLVKRVPNDELNSKVAHDVDVPGDACESVVAVAGSVDESVEARGSGGGELPPDAVSASGDPELGPAGDVVDAAEKVESWDLSEAVAKNVQDGDGKVDLKPKVSEDGSPARGGEVESAGFEAPSGAGEVPAEGAVEFPVEEGHEVADATKIAEPDEEASTLIDGEEKSVDVSVGAAVPVLPSESDRKEGADPEHPPEGPPDMVDSKTLDAPVDVEEKSVVEDVGEAGTMLPSESGEIDDVSPQMPATGPSDSVDSEEREAPEHSEGHEPEVVHNDVKPTSVETDKGLVKPESVPAAAAAADDDDVKEKSVEVKSEDTVLPSETSADDKDVSREHEPAEVSLDKVGSGSTRYAPVEEVHEVVESTIDAEPESMSGPLDDVEDKSVEVNFGDVPEDSTELGSADNEVAGSDAPLGASADNVGCETLDPDVVEHTPSAEPKEEKSAEPELVSAPDHVEEKSLEVNSEDTREAPIVLPSESANEEVVCSDIPAEPVDHIEETPPGASIEAKPESEFKSTETVSVSAPPSNVENKSVVVTEDSTESESADEEVVSFELPGGESADNITVDVEGVQPTASEEPVEGLAKPELVPALADTVEDKSIDLNPDDVTKVSSAPETSDNEDVSREPSAEEPLSNIGREVTLYAPAEEVHEAVEATISGEPESMPSPSHKFEDGFVMVDSKEVPEASTDLESADNEIVNRELPVGGSADNVSSEALEPEPAQDVVEATTSAVPEEESPEPKLVSAADHVEGKSIGVNSEGTSEAVTVLPSESAGNEVISRKFSAEGSADKVDAQSAPEEVEPAVCAAEKVGTGEHPSEEMLGGAMPGNAPDGHSSEEPSVVGHEKTLSTDDGVALVDRCVQVEELPHGSASESQRSVPVDDEENAGDDGITDGGDKDKERSAGTQSVSGKEDLSVENLSHMLQTEMTDEEAAHVASQPVEDVPRLLQTVMTDEQAKAAAAHHPEKSGAPEESGVGNAPPWAENEVTPRSYNLDAVASELHDAAEKALEGAQTSDIGDEKASVAQSVAHIVLDESSKTGDSSEYISGVIQDVAHLAQNAASSDPNILPDTVARVFDGETEGSPANETSEHKGTTSLGNMVSLFIVWCVSLCASHIPSKDMPAPALKLAAEEVTSVLHSNAPSQPAPSHHEAAASSNH